MHKSFYYLRKYSAADDNLHPFACVCILKSDDGKISRGISICSPKDVFSKRIGRSKAFGYALKGMKENVYKRNSTYAYRIHEDISDVEYFSDEKHYPQSLLLFDGETYVDVDLPLTKFEKSLLDD